MTTRKREGLRPGATASGGLLVALDKRPQLIMAGSLLALAIMAGGAILYFASAYAMPLFAAFIFAVVLAPLCRWIEWLRIPAALAALLAMILASGVVYAGVAFVAQPAASWIDQAPETLQKAQRQLRKLQEPFKTVQDLSHQVEDFSIMPNQPKPRTVVIEGPGLTQSLIASAQVILVQTAFVMVLTYFFLLTKDELRLKIIALQQRLCDRVRTARIFRDVERSVAGYMVAFSLINLSAGIAVGIACWRLGLPNPAMWGGIAAILNFVPYLGPAVTIGLLGLAGLSTFDTLLPASYPVLAYLAISFIEANIVTPAIMSRRMTLNPLAIMLALSFWTWIWGPVGALISLPLLIMLKVVCDHTPSLRAVGALVGGPLERSRKLSEAKTADKIAEKQVEQAQPDEVPGEPAGEGTSPVAA